MPKYHVARSVLISAAAQRIYDVIADYQTWTTWSPWLLADPAAKVSVSTPANQIGSTYAWDGPVTGAGILTHQTMESGRRIVDRLEFLKPFKTTCSTSFEIVPEGNGTRVTWHMDAAMPWFLFWMIPMMKTFIGMDYQRGLNMMKEWIETGAIQSKSVVHGIETIGPLRMAGIANRCPVEEVGPAMDRTFGECKQEFAKMGLPTNGLMLSVYTKFQVKAGVFEYISGYTIPSGTQIASSSRLKTWELPSTQAFRVEHIGSYGHLGNGWSVANQLVRHKKLKQQKCGAFEIYRTMPPATPMQAAQTDIYLPIR